MGSTEMSTAMQINKFTYGERSAIMRCTDDVSTTALEPYIPLHWFCGKKLDAAKAKRPTNGSRMVNMVELCFVWWYVYMYKYVKIRRNEKTTWTDKTNFPYIISDRHIWSFRLRKLMKWWFSKSRELHFSVVLIPLPYFKFT